MEIPPWDTAASQRDCLALVHSVAIGGGVVHIAGLVLHCGSGPFRLLLEPSPFGPQLLPGAIMLNGLKDWTERRETWVQIFTQF